MHHCYLVDDTVLGIGHPIFYTAHYLYVFIVFYEYPVNGSNL